MTLGGCRKHWEFCITVHWQYCIDVSELCGTVVLESFKDLLRHTSALLIRNTAVHLLGVVTALLVRSDCALSTTICLHSCLGTFLVTFQQDCPCCSDVILHTCLFLLFLFYSVIIILGKWCNSSRFSSGEMNLRWFFWITFQISSGAK